MTAKSTARGWEIEWSTDIEGPSGKGFWVWSDTKEPLPGAGGADRPCKRCGADMEQHESDRCLGDLPGVNNACCGHGDESKAYIRLNCGIALTGDSMKEFLEGMREFEKSNKSESCLHPVDVKSYNRHMLVGFPEEVYLPEDVKRLQEENAELREQIEYFIVGPTNKEWDSMVEKDVQCLETIQKLNNLNELLAVEIERLKQTVIKMRNCENCSEPHPPCTRTYGSTPKEDRCHPDPGQPFYMAHWSLKKK